MLAICVEPRRTGGNGFVGTYDGAGEEITGLHLPGQFACWFETGAAGATISALRITLSSTSGAHEGELDDLTGTAPGACVGGPDRPTREGAGVVDGHYIPPGTVIGPWMLAK